MFRCLTLIVAASAVAAATPAPQSCAWVDVGQVNGDSDFLSCRIKTIGDADDILKNITATQVHNINRMVLTCTDLLFFESSLHVNTGSFLGQLRRLKDLRIEYCKIRYVPATVLSPLRDLSSLSLRSHNTDWPSMTMEFHAESFRGLMELRTLDLGDNNIWALPAEVFCPLFSLKTLNLTENRLQDISDIGFSDWGKGPTAPGKSCNTGLKILDLSHNTILMLPDNGLSSLRSLEELLIQDNAISEVGDRAFVGLTSLKVLNISSNKLVALPPELFQSSRDVKQIYLANNSLSVLAPGLLEGLDQLQVLDLSHNKLTNEWVNRDTFSGLIRLVLLNLSNNKLTRLDPKLFQDLNNLQELNLDNNHIELISNGAFVELKNLHMLTISQNRLKVIDESHFSNLYVLNQLYLDNNNLRTIHPRAFENITYLQDLSVAGNYLERIPEGIKKLRFLKSLDMGKNNISKVENASFEGLEELYGLRLVDNNIEVVSKDAFITLPSLQVLNLASNKIVSIEKDAFAGNPTLKAIRLDGNKLSDISGVFTGLQTLGWLNISDNQLRSFDYGHLPDGVEWLDMHQNLITKLDNKLNVQSSNIRTLDASFNSLTEIQDSSIPNNVENLYLNNNQIGMVKSGTFSLKKHLRRVVLHGNVLRVVELSAFTLPHIPKTRNIPHFYIGNNPFICNCHMSWLQKINQWNHLRQYPRFMDLEEVQCQLVHGRNENTKTLMEVPPSQFLCAYDKHCSSHCFCCDFEACDCKMTCPDRCSCYHDNNWSSNVIDCSYAQYTKIPEKIPMDATELYLDGNNLGSLDNHIFIGKKKLNVLLLNNSNIVSVSNGTFNGLYSLKMLHLENNGLTELKGDEFHQTQHLKELYLGHNAISDIGNNTFSSLLSLQTLGLENNKIVNFNNQGTLSQSVQHVYIEGNMWSCDCDNLIKVEKWLKNNPENPNKMNCVDSAGLILNVTLSESLIKCYEMLESNVISSENQPFASEDTNNDRDNINFVPLLAIVLIAVILLCLLGALMFSFRQDVRIWAHSKYGVRIFKDASVQESEIDKDRMYDGYVIYSLLDDDFVSKLIGGELEQSGYSLCLHYRDLQLPPENCLTDALTNAADSSKRLIFIISFNFLQNEWSKASYKKAIKSMIETISSSMRRHKVVFIVTTDVSALNVDPDLQMFFKSCTVIFWGEKRFWEKIRFAMPDIANLQWNKSSLNFNNALCPNARRTPLRYTASPTASEQWYKYAALPPQRLPPQMALPPVAPEDDSSMLTNTTLTSQIYEVDPLNHSYISIDSQNYEQAYGGRVRHPAPHPTCPSPSALDEQGYLRPRASVHECMPSPHVITVLR